jgi:hypothetical protein
MWTREQTLCDDARKEVETARMRVARVRLHLKDVYRTAKINELLEPCEAALKALDEHLKTVTEGGEEP